MRFKEVTQGCITVGIAPLIDISVDISNIGTDSSVIISASESGDISYKDSSDSELYISDKVSDTEVTADYCNTGTSLNYGIVCGVDLGLPVLYASDGVLITIDGQYLIVQKEE